MSSAGDRDGALAPAVQGMNGASAGRSVAPIYRRLPRGPHGLDARQIAVHQRTRIQGALVEAVARDGYDCLTVRAVIELAGVSRRSFYEQFDNRHDCFMQTAASLVREGLADARGAGHSTRGRSPDAALRAGLGSLVSSCRDRPAAARLVLLETIAAGEDGAALLGESLVTGERLLAGALAGGAEGPAGVTRAVAGALGGILTAALEAGPPADAGELTAIALASRMSAPDSEKLRSALRDRARRAAVAAAARRAEQRATDAASAPVREKVLHATLRVCARRAPGSLAIPEIADVAGIGIGELLEHFDGPSDCLQAALAEAGGTLVTIAQRAASVAAGPADRTRLALAGLLGHLAASPHQASGLAFVAHRAGASATRDRIELDRRLGAALATTGPAGGMPAAGASGALWHVVRHAILAGGLHVLPALSDHLAFALLAPAIGAGPAVAALSGAANDG